SWSGACAGQHATCSLGLLGGVTTHAAFKSTTPPPTGAPAPIASTGRPRESSAPGSSPLAAPSGPTETIALSQSSPSEAAIPAPTGSDQGIGNVNSTNPSGTDLTPIVLAIVIAGLLIGGGIVVAGFEIRRRGNSRSGD